MKTEERFVGINASKNQLEIGVLPVDQFWKTPNDETGRQEVTERLSELAPALVVMEASGGYETPIAIHLVAAGLRVAVINPSQIQDFANAKGEMVKPAHIDARMLALFAQVIRPQVRPLKDQRSRDLDALFVQRRQIVDMLTMEKNRLAKTARRVRRSIQAHIAHIVWLEKRLDNADSDLKMLILHQDSLKNRSFPLHSDSRTQETQQEHHGVAA